MLGLGLGLGLGLANPNANPHPYPNLSNGQRQAEAKPRPQLDPTRQQRPGGLGGDRKGVGAALAYVRVGERDRGAVVRPHGAPGRANLVRVRV